MTRITSHTAATLSTTNEGLLSETFVRLADSLVDDFKVGELLSHLADRCVQLLDVSGVGIMLAASGERLRSVASSSAAVRTLQLYEERIDESPALDCFRSGTQVINQSLVFSKDRWPDFAPRALDAGFRSVHALPMRLRGRTIGALTLLRVHSGRIKDGHLTAAQALADVASIAILQNRAITEVRALNGRLEGKGDDQALIEQAKGILAERTGCGVEQASSALDERARSTQLALVDIARALVDETRPEELFSHRHRENPTVRPAPKHSDQNIVG